MQLQPVCAEHKCRVEFAINHAEKLAKKRDAKHRAELKQKIKEQNEKDKAVLAAHKNSGYYMGEADKQFQRFCRLRDYDDPCISCGKYDFELVPDKNGGKWDGGHFLSKGARPELRYEPSNCHKQCKSCNKYKGGGQAKGYRDNLIEKIGIDKVLWLEGAHSLPRLRKDDYIRARDYWKEEADKLEREIKECQAA